MENLSQGCLSTVLACLAYRGLADLQATSEALCGRCSEWAKTLPTTPAELKFRGQSVDGHYWLKVGDRPTLLRCVGLSGSAEVATLQLPGTRWNFCGTKSNRGGAGSHWHWHVTHHLHFDEGGKLLAWLDGDTVDAANTDGHGHWSLAEEELRLTFFDQTHVLRRSADGDALYSERSAAFLVSAPMVATPAAYLPLTRPNFSTLPVGGTVHGESIRTDFEAVRLLLPELQIACADFTFTRATGAAYIVGSNGACRTDYAHSMFGFAQGSCGPNAFARIDLRGTPFSVACRFLPTGCGPRGKAKHSSNGQVVLVAGTGGQGACAPTYPGTDDPQYPCCDDGHADVLWQKGNCYNQRPFLIELKFREDEPDSDWYGRCHVADHPDDWY